MERDVKLVRGITLIESITTVVLLSAVVLLALFFITLSNRTNKNAEDEQQAYRLAQEKLQELQNSTSTVRSGSDTLGASTLKNATQYYRRWRIITTTTPYRIELTVSWQGRAGKLRSTQFSGYLANENACPDIPAGLNTPPHALHLYQHGRRIDSSSITIRVPKEKGLEAQAILLDLKVLDHNSATHGDRVTIEVLKGSSLVSASTENTLTLRQGLSPHNLPEPLEVVLSAEDCNGERLKEPVAFTLSFVLATNFPPLSVALSNTSFPADAPAGFVIGLLTGEDGESPQDSLSYHLSGTAVHKGLVTTSGERSEKLVVNRVTPAMSGTYSLYISAIDPQGLDYTNLEPIEIVVTDPIISLPDSLGLIASPSFRTLDDTSSIGSKVTSLSMASPTAQSTRYSFAKEGPVDTTPKGLFKLNTTTGVVTTAQTLLPHGKEQLVFTAFAFDHTTLVDTVLCTLSVVASPQDRTVIATTEQDTSSISTTPTHVEPPVQDSLSLNQAGPHENK